MVSVSRRIAVLFLAGTTLCRAVMFKSTDDPAFNTTAPGGALTNSGWQWQGAWGAFLGTPIAPTFFIAAKHVGGSIGQSFVLNGFTYQALTNFPDPASDLQIWQVAETFPSYAPLYTNANEVGKACVVFGRGTRRGAAVIVDGVTNGWQWGASDGVMRWGENQVASTVSGGTLLRATFDRAAGSNECHLSVGDSSGGMFIQEGGVWKLAGIHHAVDGPFSNETYGVINAALLDRGGFCEVGGSCFPDLPQDNPSGFYSVRISARLAWILSVIHFETGTDLRMTGIERVGDGVAISFTTAPGRFYRVQRGSDFTWTTFTNGIAGTGGIVTVLDSAGGTNQFYRVGFDP